MRVGILASGNIATKMAKTISKLEKVELRAVASREKDKAKSFAKEFNMPFYYGSYEELYKSGEVDLIYIATPHSHHYKNIINCLENNKHVLCEKAFVLNEEQAKRVFKLAKEKNLLLLEGMWLRFRPLMHKLKDIIKSKELGNITGINANIGYDIKDVRRIYDMSLAAGALLDIGIYLINFTILCLGDNYKKVSGICSKREDTGSDIQENITIEYENGILASLYVTTLTNTDKRAFVYFEKGYIEVDDVNWPTMLSLYDSNKDLIRNIKEENLISGYEFEVLEAKNCIDNNLIESKYMMQKDTLLVLKIMDSLRKDWNIIYPGDLESL